MAGKGIPFTKNDPRICKTGRPKGTLNRSTFIKKIHDAKERIKHPITGKIQYLTQGEIIVLSLYKEARSGNVQAFKEIYDNLFGKQKESLEVESNNHTTVDITQPGIDELLRKFNEQQNTQNK